MEKGGFQKADKDSEPVKNAAKFAVHEKFPDSNVSFEIVDALQQLVAGMNYDLTLKVTEYDTSLCTTHKYRVFQGFDQVLSLSKSTDLGACA